MTDRPIIFSASMVDALLAGRKTQTRRILKDVPPSPGDDALNPNCKVKHEHPYLDNYRNAKASAENPGKMSENWCWWTRDDRQCLPTFKVRFVPGDRLWVRESWKPYSLYNHLPPRDMPKHNVFYLADRGYSPSGSRGRPGIHMPRWASRLTLTVTDVRVQRLAEISDADAVAEGIEWVTRTSSGDFYKNYGNPSCPIMSYGAFGSLWRHIHGNKSWAENPTVVAVSFDVHKINIDQLPRAAEQEKAA